MKSIAFAALAALAVSRAFAVEAVPSDVAEFTRKYVTAVQEKGLAGTVPFLHPDAQAQLKDQMIEVFRITGQESRIRATFGEKATLADLEAMPADRFLAGALAQYGGEIDYATKLVKSFEIIGAVREGEMYHVITRTVSDIFGQKLTNVSVTPLQRYRGEWRALLTSVTEGKPKFERPDLGTMEPPPPPIPPPRR